MLDGMYGNDILILRRLRGLAAAMARAVPAFLVVVVCSAGMRLDEYYADQPTTTQFNDENVKRHEGSPLGRPPKALRGELAKAVITVRGTFYRP